MRMPHKALDADVPVPTIAERLHIAARCVAPDWSAARLPDNGWYLSLGGFDGI